MHCQACSGLIMQPGVGYQYAGKVCYCNVGYKLPSQLQLLIQQHWDVNTQLQRPTVMQPLPPLIPDKQETYEAFVSRTNKRDTFECLLLGLCGEAGEVADVFKKHLYKNAPLNTNQMTEELGDVLWYVTALATKLNMTLDDLQELNKYKLNKRAKEESNKL